MVWVEWRAGSAGSPSPFICAVCLSAGPVCLTGYSRDVKGDACTVPGTMPGPRSGLSASAVISVFLLRFCLLIKILLGKLIMSVLTTVLLMEGFHKERLYSHFSRVKEAVKILVTNWQSARVLLGKG